MVKYFIIAASKDHVFKGIEGGFAQAGHGRKDYISKPSKGDWIIFYSSKDKFENGSALQKFTALAKVIDDEIYQPSSNSNLKPYRRRVEFIKSNEAGIRSLLPQLSFIKNKTNWGFYLMSGFKEISKEDFEVIKNAMK